MRLKYQSLIALGISSVLFSGCTSGSGGFLNLGVADALRKSQICAFNKKLTYEKTPIGSTGLSLPTFGTASTSAPIATNQPTPIGNYPSVHGYPVAQQPIVQRSVVQQSAPVTSSDCGCNTSPNNTGYSQDLTSQFYMPTPQLPIESSAPAQPTTSPEVIEPAFNTVPQRINEDSETPPINLLPGEVESGPDRSGGALELGQTETSIETSTQPSADEGFSFETHSDKIVDRPVSPDKSILESVKAKQHIAPARDEVADIEHLVAKLSKVKEEAKMVTLHARPAQSHNLFDRVASQEKTLETLQASHKRQFRQQNLLRPPAPSYSPNYRQAKAPEVPVDFKPLPPIKPTGSPAGPPASKTNLQPLTTPTGNTRMAEASDNHTASVTPKNRRVPLLRATTASSASILSLKNLANVIQEGQTGDSSYYQRTAKESQATPGSGEGTSLK